MTIMFLLKQTFSLQTFHLISIPKDPSPETISTSNFQFTPEIAFTVGVVSLVYILFFAVFVIFTSIVFCCCKMSKKRGDRLKNENNQQAMQVYVNSANPDNLVYATIENNKPDFNPLLINPVYDLKMKEAPIIPNPTYDMKMKEAPIIPNPTYDMKMKAAPKESFSRDASFLCCK